MANSSPQIVSTRRMEAFFRHNNVEWAAHCFVSNKSTIDNESSYHADIQTVLNKHGAVFGAIPLGCPLDRGFEVEHMMELEQGSKTSYHNTLQASSSFQRGNRENNQRVAKNGTHTLKFQSFASSMLLVKEKDETLCVCIDQEC